MILFGHISLCFGKKMYYFHRKRKLSTFFGKFIVVWDIPSSGEDFAEKWVVDEEN
jgi:hypothetical protein